MTVSTCAKGRFRLGRRFSIISMIGLVLSLSGTSAFAAIVWDGEAGTQWWFDPVNWNVNSNVNNLLPPNGGGAFDAQINMGTGSTPGGEGIVYDPANDPHFSAAGSLSYPADRGPQIIDQLYLSRNTTNHNLVTIKGDLTSMANVIVGRSGSVADAENPGQFIQNLGRINQLGGIVKINNNVLDVGQREASGWGNGIYDYRGGTLEVSLNSGNGIRLAGGGSAGTGGHGRFIMRNPSTPGYVRAFNFNVAAHGGIADNPGISPDGITTGVGIVEFHYENGGTRPIQVSNQLLINNGMVTTGTRSSRLELVLDSPVTVNGGGVPINLGLFDVDFAFDPINSEAFAGIIGGAGDLGLFFSNADGSALYNEGATVSATFGSTRYDWTISYSGDISWINPETSEVGTILGAGNGVDVVLIGLGSESAGLAGDFNGDQKVDGRDFLLWQRNTSVGSLSDWQNNYGTGALTATVSAVPEPTGLVLLCAAALPLLGRRR